MGICTPRALPLVFKVGGIQRGVAEVGYKTARRLENESKLDIARNAIHFSVITRKSVHVRNMENILLYPGSHSK